MSETDVLDSAESFDRRDEGGLLPVQREQIDRLLIEAGDDPHLKAALSAMFFIALHQDNSVKQHIIAHREALRDDMRTAMRQLSDAITMQHQVIDRIIAQLDETDITRRAQFTTIDRTQEEIRTEIQSHGATMRAQAWTLWAIGGAVFLLLLVGMMYVLLH
jgi:hypothetical protein